MINVADSPDKISACINYLKRKNIEVDTGTFMLYATDKNNNIICVGGTNKFDGNFICLLESDYLISTYKMFNTLVEMYRQLGYDRVRVINQNRRLDKLIEKMGFSLTYDNVKIYSKEL